MLADRNHTDPHFVYYSTSPGKIQSIILPKSGRKCPKLSGISGNVPVSEGDLLVLTGQGPEISQTVYAARAAGDQILRPRTAVPADKNRTEATFEILSAAVPGAAGGPGPDHKDEFSQRMDQQVPAQGPGGGKGQMPALFGQERLSPLRLMFRKTVRQDAQHPAP